ncbi:MAG: ParB/RepB/Spo0J family partition protein, partial [Clostridia bacterium]|nr:ParB/RepB/Spo0J family partition protein [Clostridia bacterium]
KDLAESIKQHGIIQPIIVVKDDLNYMVVAGERRLRASRIAGLREVPCIIKKYGERQVKEVALIENLQREDLSPIESARAIKQLMEEYSLTQETVSEKIGKSRSNVANLLRLLNLHPDVIKLIESNQLSAGHARVLVVIDDIRVQIDLAEKAVDKKLSVRELEKCVKDYLSPNKILRSRVLKAGGEILELNELVEEMQKTFATKVIIKGDDKKGKIVIEYFSRDDLDRIYELIKLVKNKQLTLQDLSQFNCKR